MPGSVVVRAAEDRDDDVAREIAAIAFHQSSDDADRRERHTTWRAIERVVADEDGTVVATAGAYPWRVSVPGGGDLPIAAVTNVTVLPTHRRRGILRAMLDRVVADARGRGEPLAGLWASEATIYGRFGFGPAGWVRDLRAPLHGPAPLGGVVGVPEDTAVRLLRPDDARDAVVDVFERARGRRPGLMARDERWWTARVLGDHPDDRDGAGPLRAALLRDEGYALYRVREGAPTSPVGAHTTVEVQELVGVSAGAERELLAFLARIDLADELLLVQRPVDDALLQATGDVRALRPAEPHDALWIRVLDLPRAAAARSWAAPLDVVLQVDLDGDPELAGRWRLRVDGGGTGRAERTDAEADVVLPAGALGSLYLGGVTATLLQDAGRLREATSGALESLDAALRVPRGPWTAGLF